MQQSFLALANTKKLRKEKFLEEMEKVIMWKEFVEAIKPHYQEKELGRKRVDILILLKMYFLQQWFHLSDPAVEEEVYDRSTFQKFLGIDLMREGVPDETTVCKFRHLLERYGLQKKFFEIVNEKLEEKGLICKEGTSVDATIIKAPSSTKNQKKKRDEEMKSCKKGNDWFFGMKAHIGADAKTGFVHSLCTSSANEHDRDYFERLLHGDEKSVFGDKGYYKQEDKKKFREQGIFFGVLDKATRGTKLSGSQEKRNKKLSSVRSKVEHVFQVIKYQWKHVKVRYKGLYKNTMQLNTLFALANVFRARKLLMA